MELVRSIQKMLERVIGEDIELSVLIDPQAGSFMADPGQMEQVLLNFGGRMHETPCRLVGSS